ncbi:MAG: glycosyl hydrolase [Ferruginibacter sp.]
MHIREASKMVTKSKVFLRSLFLMSLIFAVEAVDAQTNIAQSANLQQLFKSPPPAASPWVFWYWNQAAVSTEGITADLQAMQEAGIGGAYLMFIKGAATPPLIEPAAVQLSPAWWQMVKHAMAEAKRLNIKIGIHLSDGFALAGGPWITPELSMQKIVWTKTFAKGNAVFNQTLEQPLANENYYKDIAVFAYPSANGSGISTQSIKPTITASKEDEVLQLLTDPANSKNFASNDSCWIQYEFQQPFTCRTIVIRSVANYQSNRLLVQVSNDGIHFKMHTRLEPSRHGWQDWDENYTHSIPPVTARFFRFVYDKKGTEPGAEDLNTAKWKPALKVTGIELSGEPTINGYEGKNGSIWRISKRTTKEQIADNNCVPLNKAIDITVFLSKDGKLNWKVPAGNWTIIRIGHTSTAHKNDTGGGGKGLECDKFNPEAIRMQFDNWFGAIYKETGKETADSILKVFHIDSWECGSQNWSPVFRAAFKFRRGYDLYPYLPVMAGIPVESVESSEQFLHDVRTTITELINENFYATLAKLAHEKNCSFTAESIAPTMVSDALLHYQHADVPMGEFWLRSPTHDKPNDMADAISGAHIYGKNIIQAEAFTELRLSWDEHPGMLKALQDRNYALGINRLSYHVFMHNPWINRKPGMTLDGIGLFFQKDQTWWKQGKAWVDYAKRCQALLQVGKPVVDIAVFIGEEVPSRSVLPENLVATLPGIIGKELVAKEKIRLANVGEPMIQSPPGVNHSANMINLDDWSDPLHGYAYDSYNKDALLRISKTQSGSIALDGGANYKLLVLPTKLKMIPNGNLMSDKVALQLRKLVTDGATLLVNEKPTINPGLNNAALKLSSSVAAIWNNKTFKAEDGIKSWKLGKGQVIQGPYTNGSFEAIGFAPDFIAVDTKGMRAKLIAWNHRTAPGVDIYFISNQQDSGRIIEVSLRVIGRIPEIWDAVTGNIQTAKTWKIEKDRTVLPVQLEPNGSVFVVLQQPAKSTSSNTGRNWIEPLPAQSITGPWLVNFDSAYRGYSKPIVFDTLSDWSKNSDTVIRYYAGTAAYKKDIEWNKPAGSNQQVWLNLNKVANIAEVFVNGINCGVLWTAPFRADISKALKEGKNEIRIEVTNTWANRIIGDERLTEEKRFTNTNAPYRIAGRPLLAAGLIGPVQIELSGK